MFAIKFFGESCTLKFQRKTGLNLLIFSDEHYHYTTHNCPNAYKKNNQVPVCPLCNTPMPVPKGQQPDFVVGQHIGMYTRFFFFLSN